MEIAVMTAEEIAARYKELDDARNAAVQTYAAAHEKYCYSTLSERLPREEFKAAETAAIEAHNAICDFLYWYDYTPPEQEAEEEETAPFWEELVIGCSPLEEECTQVSDKEDYITQMMKEVQAYARQLERTHPIPDDVQAFYKIVRNSHEFGMYAEVNIRYLRGHKPSDNYALMVEGNCPLYWDEAARQELGLKSKILRLVAM